MYTVARDVQVCSEFFIPTFLVCIFFGTSILTSDLYKYEYELWNEVGVHGSAKIKVHACELDLDNRAGI